MPGEMRADDGDLDAVATTPSTAGAGGGARPVAPIGAPRERHGARAADAGDQPVRARARDQRHAEGRPSARMPEG